MDTIEGEQEVGREFFMQSPVFCAERMPGMIFEWRGRRVRIVETEAYDAEGDPACHTWNRPSARKFVRDHPAGTAYVYLNYGVHWLFNILVKGGEREGFVLVRAVEWLGGGDLMSDSPACADIKAGSGPGKTTRLLGMDGSAHGMDLFAKGAGAKFRFSSEPWKIVSSARIGISRGTELSWRFFLANHPAVSGKRFALEKPGKTF